MNKKSKIIIIILAVILAVVLVLGGIWLYFRSQVEYYGANGAETVTIIGGKDGPTEVFITEKK